MKNKILEATGLLISSVVFLYFLIGTAGGFVFVLMRFGWVK